MGQQERKKKEVVYGIIERLALPMDMTTTTDGAFSMDRQGRAIQKATWE